MVPKTYTPQFFFNNQADEWINWNAISCYHVCLP